MKTFNDNAGRTWNVEVNVVTIKRVRGLVQVNLYEVIEGRLIERFIRDPVLLCDCLYAVCKPQADELGVTDEEFGRAMAGDAIEHATVALLDELVSFCPSLRDRKNLRRVLDGTRKMMERGRDVIEAKLDRGELEKAAEQALAALDEQTQEMWNDSSGSAPESSGSTPGS